MKTYPEDSRQIFFKKRILRSLLIVSAFIIVFYLLFEVVEFWWLSDLDMEMLHLIYIIRGLFISLLAVTLVAWLLIRSSQPLLSSEEWVKGKWQTVETRIIRFNHWFIAMRWVAIFVASILIFVVVRINEWLPMKVWWPLMTMIALLVFLNISYQLLLKKGGYDQRLLPFQAYADLIVLIIMLHFSGGIENPLTLMMLIHVFIAGIILSRKHLYAVTASAIFLLVIMAGGEAIGKLDHYTLNVFPHFEEHGTHIHAAHMPLYVLSHVGLMVTIFLLTAYFVGTIMNRIRHDEIQLETFANQSLEQRQLIEKALETAGTGLCVLDQNGSHHLTNQTWAKWFGPYSSEKLNENAEYKSIMETLADGQPRTNEFILESDASDHVNRSRIYQVTTAPLLDKDGNFDHAVALASDITDKKEAQEQMIRAGKLAAVGELAGKIAHEVNNPIGIISAKCRLMLSDKSFKLPEKVEEELKKITEASDRVSDIAKGLLSYCRPSTAERKALDLRIPIENALYMILENAEHSGILIENRLPDNLPLVEVNTQEMRQVFLNVFLNALDAMPDGGKLSIDAVLPNNDQPYLNINITDTGTGIPDPIKKEIFEPFFTTKEEGKGTGLGLSICMGLIRSHNGYMEIHSEAGTGTTVALYLPVIKTQKEEKYA